jgi:hypothetical protein
VALAFGLFGLAVAALAFGVLAGANVLWTEIAGAELVGLSYIIAGTIEVYFPRSLAVSQLAGIGVGIGVYFAGTFAAVFLPNLVQYLPFQLSTTALGAATSGGGGFGGGAAPATNVSPDLALLLLGVWLIGSLVVATGFTERAEITG